MTSCFDHISNSVFKFWGFFNWYCTKAVKQKQTSIIKKESKSLTTWSAEAKLLTEYEHINIQTKKIIQWHGFNFYSTMQFYSQSFRNAEIGQASHSFIHSVTLRKLSTCTTSVHWSAAAGTSLQSLLAKELPLQSEKITPIQTKTHHNLFICMLSTEPFLVFFFWVRLTITLLKRKLTIILGVECFLFFFSSFFFKDQKIRLYLNRK